MQWHSYSNQ